LVNLPRPSPDDPIFKGLFFGNQGQQILKFAWNKQAGKAYPIFLRDTKNFVPLQFSRLISNPDKALIDWHPEYAKKMLRYEIEVIDQAEKKDANYDTSKGKMNRMQLIHALDALNQHQRLLERQAKLQERSEASSDVLKSEIVKPSPKKSDLAITKEVGKDLRKQGYTEVAIPVLEGQLTKVSNQAVARGEKALGFEEKQKIINNARFINAYLQGATGRSGGQLNKSLEKNLITAIEVGRFRSIRFPTKNVPDLKKEEVIKGEFTRFKPRIELPPELRFKAPTLPTKTEQDFKREQDRLTSARNDINNDRFKNEISGELLSAEEKKELLEMNRNSLDRVEHNINQFKKTPNNRVFAVKGLPEGSGVGAPIQPIRLVYEQILAKKRGDIKQVEDLERRINLVKQQSAIQSSKQIGGEREVSAIFSNKTCPRCVGTGVTSFGRTCPSCGGSGSPLQAMIGKQNIFQKFIEKEQKRIGGTGTSFVCRDCNKKGFTDPRCKKCAGRTIIFPQNIRREEAGRELVKATPPLENLFRQQGEFIPKKTAI